MVLTRRRRMAVIRENNCCEEKSNKYSFLIPQRERKCRDDKVHLRILLLKGI
jgi:hypothetical protein